MYRYGRWYVLFFVLKLNRTSLFVVLSIHVYMCRTVIMKGRGGAWCPTSLGNLLDQQKKNDTRELRCIQEEFYFIYYKYILDFYILDFLRIYLLCFLFFELKKRKRGLHVLDATGSKKNARIKASEKIMIKLQS